MTRTHFMVVVAMLALVVTLVWIGQHQEFEAASELRYLTKEENDQLNGIDPNVDSASVDDEALETLAATSCKCARSSDGSDASDQACWQDYKAATAKFETYSMAAACAPISTVLECVATDKGEKCWVISFGDEICTADEARAVENAYTAAMEAEGDFNTLDEAAAHRANERANAAYMDVIDRLKRGETVAARQTSGGCAG